MQIFCYILVGDSSLHKNINLANKHRYSNYICSSINSVNIIPGIINITNKHIIIDEIPADYMSNIFMCVNTRSAKVCTFDFVPR